MKPTLLALAACLLTGTAHAATDIDLFFPVPVQGKLANEMQRLVEVFNKDHADIHVTPVYSGSYDDTNLKTHAAIQAGKPPAAVIMSANFVREYVINDEIVNLDTLIAKDGQSPDAFISQFWPRTETERHRTRPRQRCSVPELDTVALLQRRRLQ